MVIYMVERIVGLVVCLLCAFPLFIMAHYNKNSKEPIVFWAGDEKRLKRIIKNVEGYNAEISHLYAKCVLAFVICGILFLVWPVLGCAVVVFCATIGIYIVWRLYQKILAKYL